MDIEYRDFSDKKQLYTYINEKLQLIGGEVEDETAILANASALLKLQLNDVNWAGFYLMKNGRLVLGPFQGKPAVAIIPVGSGVCGTAVEKGETQLVEDVHACCNHIACDLATSSEIVVPIRIGGEIAGVIDIDSPVSARFDSEDKAGLEKSAEILGGILQKIK